MSRSSAIPAILGLGLPTLGNLLLFVLFEVDGPIRNAAATLIGTLLARVVLPALLAARALPAALLSAALLAARALSAALLAARTLSAALLTLVAANGVPRAFRLVLVRILRFLVLLTLTLLARVLVLSLIHCDPPNRSSSQGICPRRGNARVAAPNDHL
jgi:hypothetical protein